MKAVRIQEPGGFEGIDGLIYEDASRPQPAIGNALVQVHAARITLPNRPGRPHRSGRARPTHDPGPRRSGTLLAHGYGTAGVSIGDEVQGPQRR
jgi:NADPH:quinone reductase-like Zn-dependent oxidoreductase